MIKAVKKLVLVQDEAQGVDDLLEPFRVDYLQTNDFVRATVYWMVGSEAVDDVVQVVYLKAWMNYKKFNRKSSFKTWIYRIAKNAALDHLRQEKKNFRGEDTEVADGKSQNNELTSVVRRGVLMLSLKHREVFILYYKLGFKKPEISEILGISEGTVKSRLHYAKEDFVVFLNQNGVGNER